jgi:hypothetical protein
MKKYHITFICLLSSLYLAAQQQQPRKEVMHMSLPKGTQKIEGSQFGDLKSRKFDNEKAGIFKDHTYKKDGLLIYYLYSSTAPGLRKDLENEQKQMFSLSKQKTDRITEDAKIVAVNNIRYSIIRYHESKEWYLWFFSEYDKNECFINGFVQYQQHAEVKANQYLLELLGTMHFNN